MKLPSTAAAAALRNLSATLVLAVLATLLSASIALGATLDADDPGAPDPNVPERTEADPADYRLVPESGSGRVLVAPLEEAIDPVAVDIVEQVVEEATSEGYDAVILEMNTPGGLMTSMDAIIEVVVNTDMPVIVWVTPRNAQAASAGAFVMMASDVAAMSPNTTIGSASPVAGGGGDIDETLEKKIVNEAVSDIVGYARDHGRDEKFAEDAVRDAANLEAQDALERGVIEIVADSRGDLLRQLDGIESPYKGLVLDLVDANVTEWEVPLRLKVLKVLINPNWIFLLMALGIIGIGFEITHPGTIVPGTVGAIAFLLAMYGLQVLPTNTAGLALMALAVVLFIAEVYVSSGGILGIGGAVALILGGMLLFDRDSALSIDMTLLLGVGAGAAGAFILIGRKVFAVHREKVQGGSEGMVGLVGTARHDLDPQGQVFVAGELWQARTADGASIDEGSQIEVRRVEGLTLVVAELADEPAHQTS